MQLKPIHYCPANVSIFDVWVNNGTSQCFMDTATSAVLSLYLLIFGLLRIRKFYLHGREQPLELRKPKLYYLQLFVTYFLSFLAVVKFLVEVEYIHDGQIYGYMVIFVVISKFSSILTRCLRPHSSFADTVDGSVAIHVSVFGVSNSHGPSR